MEGARVGEGEKGEKERQADKEGKRKKKALIVEKERIGRSKNNVLNCCC